MSNEKYYRYFKVTGGEAAKLLAGYDAVSTKRDQVLEDVKARSGAVMLAMRFGWGENGSLVESLVFAADYDFGAPVTITHRDSIEGREVVVVRGKGRTKEARELNARLSLCVREANDSLAELPLFKDYLINHYQIACNGIGAPSARGYGAYMISTNCGAQPGTKDVLLFAVPVKSDGCRQPEIPPSFVEITYGQFYDLTNTEVAL